MPETDDTFVADLAEELAPLLADRLDARPLRTLDEAAEWLRLSRRTVNTLITTGELAKVMVSGQPRIEQRELDRFVAERRDEPA